MDINHFLFVCFRLDSQLIDETKLFREHIAVFAEENQHLKSILAQVKKEKQEVEKKVSRQALK